MPLERIDRSAYARSIRRSPIEAEAQSIRSAPRSCNRRSPPTRHRGGSRRRRVAPGTPRRQESAEPSPATKRRTVGVRERAPGKRQCVASTCRVDGPRSAPETTRRLRRGHPQHGLEESCAAVRIGRRPDGAGQILENEHRPVVHGRHSVEPRHVHGGNRLEDSRFTFDLPTRRRLRGCLHEDASATLQLDLPLLRMRMPGDDVLPGDRLRLRRRRDRGRYGGWECHRR